MRTGVIAACVFVMPALWTASPGAFADDVPVPEPTRQQLLDPVWIEETLADIGVDRLIKLYDSEDDAPLRQVRDALALSRSFLSEHPEELRSQLQARLLTATEPELATFQELPADRVRARATRPSLIQAGDALLRRIRPPDQGGPLVASPNGDIFALGGARTKAAPPFERIQGIEVRSGVTGDLLRFMSLANGRYILPAGVSPDCERFFGITEDGRISAWNLDTGEEVWAAFIGVGDTSRASCAYSGDGTLIAVSPYLAHVVVLNIETGERVAFLDVGDGQRIEEIAFLDDDTIVGCCFDGILRQWSIADEEVVAEFEVPATCLSHDGTRAVAFVDKAEGAEGTVGFRVIDTASGEETGYIELEEPTYIYSERFDVTGERLLLCTGGPPYRLLGYEILSGELTVDLDLQGHCLHNLAPQSGNRIVDGGHGCGISLWDLSRPRIPSTTDLADPPSEIAITADGSTAMTVHADDATVRLWDTATWQEKSVFTLPEPSYRLAMSADGQRIVFVLDNEVHALDVATGQTARLLKTGNDEDVIWAIELSGDGEVAAFTVGQDKAFVIDANDGTLLDSIDSTSGGWEISLSYDGSRLLLNRRLFDRDDDIEREFQQVYAHSNVISADGRMGIFYDCFTSNSIWDLDKGEEFKDAAYQYQPELRVSASATPVAISGNGRFSVSCDQEFNVYLYDIEDREPLAVVPTDASQIVALEISETGEHLLIGTRDGIWHHFRFENLP